MLPVYFESFLPEYGDYRHNLRNDQIRLPLIRCEYGEMNVKYQMHLRLRELSTPSNPPKYHIRCSAPRTARGQYTVCPEVEKTKMDNFLLFNIWGIYLVEKTLNYH